MADHCCLELDADRSGEDAHQYMYVFQLRSQNVLDVVSLFVRVVVLVDFAERRMAINKRMESARNQNQNLVRVLYQDLAQDHVQVHAQDHVQGQLQSRLLDRAQGHARDLAPAVGQRVHRA